MKMPNVLEKREWIYGSQKTPENIREYGFACLEKQLLYDAIDCFLQIDEKSGGERILAEAISSGDFFLAKKVQPLVDISDESWRKLAENAESQEKWMFAYSTFREIDDEEKMEALKNKLKENHKGKYFEKL